MLLRGASLPPLPSADHSVQKHLAFPALQELVRELSTDWKSLKVEKACWGSSSFPVELIREVKVSLRPVQRTHPPSASCHLPAAALREISFRPA